MDLSDIVHRKVEPFNSENNDEDPDQARSEAVAISRHTTKENIKLAAVA